MSHTLVDLCFAPHRDDGSDEFRLRRPRDVEAANGDVSFLDLAARLRDSDESALELLFHQTYDRLHCLAAVYVDGDAAADVVVNVFITLWDRRRTWAPQNPEAFLYRAVRNRALDHARNDAREHRRREAFHQIVAADPSSPLLGEDDLHTAAVRAAVAELNARQREYVVLRWQEGRTPAEIATFLGTTPRAATSLQDRILTILRRRAPQILARLRQGES